MSPIASLDEFFLNRKIRFEKLPLISRAFRKRAITGIGQNELIWRPGAK
jgi:hypothetical protein